MAGGGDALAGVGRGAARVVICSDFGGLSARVFGD